MAPSIDSRLNRLELQKRRLLSDLAPWPEQRLSLRPQPGNWSALDTLDHLVKVEQSILSKMQHHLPEGHPLTFKDKVGTRFIIGIMRSPMRVKVPASAADVLPGSTTDRVTIVNAWDRVRADLVPLLQSLKPAQLESGVFRHPVGGWMPAAQTLDFISAHIRHHRYQLDRLSSKLPQTS